MKDKGKPVIAFLGALPPPIGGFSLGLERLTKRLKAAGQPYVVYDLINKRKVRSEGKTAGIGCRLTWLLGYFFTAKEDLICCHYIDWKLRAVVGLMTRRGRRTLLSIGGQSLQNAMDNGNWLKKKLIAGSLRRYSCVVAHNPVIRDLCLSLGVKDARIVEIPGFIPPEVQPEEVAAIPQEVRDFIAGHKPAIAVNAFRLSFHHGQDLYGLDLCVELCARLKPRYPDIGLVFCLGEVGDASYYEKMKKLITEKGLADNIKLLSGSYPFYPILMQSQVFLRPTNTDGDAVSVREALHFRVPTVASDVVARPESALTFKNRDIDDLTRQVTALLNDYENCKKELDAVTMEDNSVKLLELYDRLLADRGEA